MKQYTILVPMDFSDCSKNALDHALKIAKKMNAKLLLLHAYQMHTFHDGVLSPSSIERLEESKYKQTYEQFDQLKEGFPELGQVSHQFIIECAFTVDAIAAQLNNRKIDLVIMGTKGAKGLKAMTISSNTYVALQSMTCPILVIPENADFIYPKNIALAADYKKIQQLSTLNPLLEIARFFGSKIHVLHFSKASHITQREAEEAKKLGQYLRGILHRYYFSFGDETADDISEYMEKHEIQLLAIVPREHGFFEQFYRKSWTRMMAYQSDIPFVALPYR